MDLSPCCPLGGPDAFFLALDQVMRRNGGRGATCHLEIFLSEAVCVEELRTHFLCHPIYQWITRLRLRTRPWWRPPCWRIDRSALPAPIRYHGTVGGEAWRATDHFIEIDPRRDAPFQVLLIGRDQTASRLLVAWHHVLMDARGGELLVDLLGQLSPHSPVLLDPSPPTVAPGEWRQALGVKERLYAINRPPFLGFHKRRRHRRLNPQYHTITFDAIETQAVENNIRHCNAEWLRSAYYLAATARAFRNTLCAGHPSTEDVVVTVAHDCRPKGGAGPILLNHLSFLFYRIPAAALNSHLHCVAELRRQMADLLRHEIPARFVKLLLLFQRLPPVAVRFLLQRPTRGHMASFFFADMGHLGDTLTQVRGTPVGKAIHYPPNLYPPGMIVVFSRQQGTLLLTLGTMQEVHPEEWVETLLREIRKELTTPADGS